MRRALLILPVLLAACVVAPGRPHGVVVAPAAPLQITALRVDPYAPYGYELTYPYTVNAGVGVTVTRVCYRWPGGAPICAAPSQHRRGRHARIRTTHRHRNPQELTGWIEYKTGGRTRRSNEMRVLVPPRRR